MPRKNRSEWLEYEINGQWRVRFYIEPGDFVLQVEHCPDYTQVLRFDQSGEPTYHAHLYDVKVEHFRGIGSFEEKVRIAFEALKRYCSQGKVVYREDKLEYSKRIDDLKDGIVKGEVPPGVTQTLPRPIVADAYIVNSKDNKQGN